MPKPPRLADLLREIWNGCRQRQTWDTAALFRLAGVFCFATVCSWAGIMLSHQSEGVATIWLSNGIVFGLLITQPPSRWLPYFLAGLGADTLADVVYGDPFRVAVGVSLANSVEVVLSALVLTRLFGTPLNLAKRRPLVGFLGVSVVGATALTSALGATWTLLFYDAGPWLKMFRTWWLGDLLGMAILAPLAVLLQRSGSYSILRARELPRTFLVLTVPIIATALVFTHNTDPLIFFLFPALLLVAFRLGFPGTVLTIVLMTLLAIGFTVKGHGPLMLISGDHMLLHRIVVAQIFAAVSIFTMFPVAALLEEKDALQASLAESEARHRVLAQTDELTALANRRAFNLRLAAEWTQAAARESALGLLLIDADHFKQYNDVFGHLEGDECLRALSGIIARTLNGSNGLAARYGGEEFAVLLPEADSERARAMAETIRLAVVAERLPHPTGPGGIQTVSIGATSLVPRPEQTAATLVKHADQALYCAKLSGRDQVAVL
ncbi:MAG TPA: diguanylate cyclase [Acidobacteriaceae bacterium]|nr:diguanylate cyclase [Acidobacteriaceae bacterium]